MNAAKFLMLMGRKRTTWSPTDKYVDLTLYGGNMSVHRTSSAGGANHVNVRSNTARSTGKRYVEFTRDGATYQVNVGFCTAAYALGGSFQWPGGVAGSAGYLTTSGVDGIEVAGVTVGDIGVQTADGDVCCFAIDFDHGKFWVRKLGGDWNGNGGDPAANTGGFSFAAAIPGLAYLVADTPTDGGAGVTLNAGGSPFAGTVPGGFTGWD